MEFSELSFHDHHSRLEWRSSSFKKSKEDREKEDDFHNCVFAKSDEMVIYWEFYISSSEGVREQLKAPLEYFLNGCINYSCLCNLGENR